MRYILDVDGYIENVAFGSQIVNSSGVACTEYTGAMPDGFDSLDKWARDAYIRAYKIVDGNLVLDSARLAYLKAKEKSEDEENRHVTAKELYDIMNVQSSVTEEEFTAQTSGNNLLVIDGAGEQVIPKMSIKKVVNWNDLTGKTWNELRYKMATASGDIMSLTDAINAPIQAFKLYGKSTQNGTPTPTSPATITSIENPTITVCGKNLVNMKGLLDAWGSTYTDNGDNEFSISAIGQGYAKPANFLSDDATVSVQAVVTNISATNPRITAMSNNNTHLGYIYSPDTGLNTAPLENIRASKLQLNYTNAGSWKLKNVQAELGEHATDFEPYKDGGSVAIGGGDFPDLVSTSVDADGNLYNGKGYKIGYRLNSSGVEVAASVGNHAITSGFIPYTPKLGDVIRCKIDDPSALTITGNYIAWYASDHTKLYVNQMYPMTTMSQNSYDTGTGVFTFVVTADILATMGDSTIGNTAYIRFSRCANGDVTDDTANGFTVTIDHCHGVLRSLGNVKDELVVNKDGTGKFIRRIGEYKCDGTGNIGYNEQNYFIAELESLGGKANARTSIIADRYPTMYPFSASDDYWIYMRPTGNGFIFRDSRYITVADMKNYLKAQKAAGTPLTVLYELATPIETELTAEEVNAILSLKTFSPTTVIANDKGAEMEVTYANGVSTWDTIGKGTDVVSQVEIISSNKNILPCLVPSQTLNGLTITQNEDYSFTLNGTTTADTEITLAGTTMSTEALFCMRLGTEFVKSGLGDLSLKLYDYDGTDRTLLHNGGNGTITPTESYRITHATLSIPNGTALSEVTISPQIEVGSTATEYIPNKRDYKQITASMDSGDILTIDNGTVKLNDSLIGYGSNVKTFKDKCVLMISANSFVALTYYLPNVIESLKHMKIKADQIDLEGYTTINDGFSVDLEGNMTAKSGAVAGWDITEDGFTKSGKCLINNAVCNYDIKVSRPQGAGSAISISTDYNDGTTFEIYPAGIAIKNQGSSFLSGTTLRIGNTNYSSLLDCQPNGAIFYVGDISGANQLLFDANADTKLHLKGGNALADNGSWVNGSLESRKREIEEYKANALSIVKSNKIYSYLYNIEDDKANKHYGFVIPDKEDSKYRAPIECISAGGEGIDTYSMTALLWKAVQELSVEIEQLKNKEEKA